MTKNFDIGLPLENRESGLTLQKIRKLVQPFDGFRWGKVKCIHTKGMIFLAPKTTTVKFKDISAKNQKRYKKLLETLDKKTHWGLLVPISWSEATEDQPGLVWLYSQTGDYVVPIQEVFYDLIMKRWSDARFSAKDKTGRIVVRSEKTNKIAKMPKSLVAVLRSYIVND
jgi:hypothetical protein